MISAFTAPRVLVALSASLIWLHTTTAFSHDAPDPTIVGNIARLTQQAVFVFRGQAVNVRYRNLSSSMGSIPHTYVTYRVDQVIAGSPGRYVTLRFVGGADGIGGFLAATGVPLFQDGDEDILFVSNNGMEAAQANSCALVGCEFGKYRIVDGAVYEAHGSPVTGIRDGKIITGGIGPQKVLDLRIPAPQFDDMLRRPEFVARFKSLGLSVKQARARYEAEAPKTITITQEMSGLPQAGTVGSSNTSRNVSVDSNGDVSRKNGLRADDVVESLKRHISALKASGVLRSDVATSTFKDAYLTDYVQMSGVAAKPPEDGSPGMLLPPIRK